MFYKVVCAKPLHNLNLLITFENGIQKIYDITPLLNKWQIFKSLEEDTNLFNSVSVDNGGYGISWNSDIDLSCNELWNNGIEYTP